MLIDETTLLDWTGYKARGHLEAFLTRNKVPWFQGRNGKVCTTLSAVETKLGVARANEPRGRGGVWSVPEF